MSKTTQNRDVSNDLHRKLEVRAAEPGIVLSDYLLSEARELAERPTLQETLVRLAEEGPITLDESPAEIIRRRRNSE